MQKILILMFLLVIALGSCKKDRTPEPVAQSEPTKWERLSGDYKVYDTLGAFLYDLHISHSEGVSENGNPTDSLRFANYDGQFNFTVWQGGFFTDVPSTYLSIGSHNALRDSVHKRWNIYGPTNYEFNYLEDDTLVLVFDKNNIQYYLEDITPYYHCLCKQMAVKQH
jgi:hypothetical protein